MPYVVGRDLASSMVRWSAGRFRWRCPFCGKEGSSKASSKWPCDNARKGARRHLQACERFALVAKRRKVPS